MALSLFRPQTPYLYLTLPLTVLTVFFALPLLWAVYISLQDFSQDLYHPTWVGLTNYQRLLNTPGFWKSLGCTAWFVLGVLPPMVCLPLGLAVLMNGSLRGMALFRMVLYLPVITSMVVVGIAWKWLLADNGLINYALSQFHLGPVAWLTSPDLAMWSIIMVVVWKGSAYYAMMYLAHLQSLPDELYQAAEIDGASFWQKHWHITLPHLQPTLAMVATICTIAGVKVFTELVVMTKGGPIGSTHSLVYFIYDAAFEQLDLSLACAAGLVLMGMLLVLSLIQLRLKHSAVVAAAKESPSS